MKRQIGLAVVGIVVGMLSGSAGAGLIDVAAYQKTVKMTVAGYSGGTSLAGFPVLVKLSESDVSGFHYRDLLENGTDLRFADVNRNLIPYEVDTWNTNGVSLIWVKVPSLSVGTVINAYWGNADTGAAGLSSKQVWTADYVGVWHLNEAGVTSYDSTSNGLNAANYSVTTNISDGKIGAARRISNAAKGIQDSSRISVPYSTAINLGNTFTISGWMRYKVGQATGWDRIFGRKSAWNDGSGWEVTTVDGSSSKLDVRGIGSTSPQPTVTDFTVGQWVNLAFVFSNTTVSVYLNGTNKLNNGTISAASDNTNPLVFGNNGAFNEATLKGSLDEVRYRDGLASADWTKAEYETVNNASFLTYGAVRAPDLSEPSFKGSPSIVLTPDGAGFAVSAELSNGSGDLIAVYGPVQPYAYTNLIASGVTVGAAVTNTLSGFPADRTLTYAVVATNTTSAAVSAVGADVFLSGDLNITKTADAAEENFVHGTFTLTRPVTATNQAFTVAYTVSGTAVASTNYVPLSGYATFPVGVSSTTIDVVPLLETANANSPTLTVTLVPGLYFMGDNASASMTIQNWNPPADKNCWVGSGNASVAANWTQGVPKAGDDIFLSAFSSAAMTWDAGVNGLPATVASWTQDSYYTGTVTFLIKYPTFAGAVFTNFTVAGNATVNGGFWTHPQSLTVTTGSAYTLTQLRANQQYRLCATIGGNLTVGPSGKIDASGKGYFHTAGVNISPSHGGRFNNSSSVASYGNPKFPQDVGFASNQGTDSASKRAAGGGAILLSVGGTATVNGSITVDGGINSLSTGAGGSLILQATTVTGTGSLLSEGPAASGTTSTSGVGGRIAVITTTPVDMNSLTISASVVGRDNCGGCGTIYLKDSTTSSGMLIVRDLKNTGYSNDIAMCTPVIAEGDWTFDRICLGGVARLTVPVGSTLSLPGGLASVFSTDVALRDSILYQGGTLSIGSPATHVVESNWVFSATSPCVINGNMLVRNGGVIGLAYLVQNIAPANALTLTLQINGDLEIASTGSIMGTEGGTMLDSNLIPLGYSIASHGGRDGATSKAFGSILNPMLPGLGMLNSYGWMRGGAALKLTVTGNLKLDGIAQSDGWIAAGGGPHGSAGSLNFTLGSLSGNGSISAKGTTANAGGRIAIRLTAPGATFDAFGIGDITANGPAASCSAGTIYLETASDVANGGRIIVKNNNSTSTVMTPIPANGIMADDPKNLKNTSLSVEAKARIDISANLTLASVALAANTKCELNGFELVTKAMAVGGVRVAPGTYRAGSSLFTQGYVTDISASQTGFVTVRGAGTVLTIR